MKLLNKIFTEIPKSLQNFNSRLYVTLILILLIPTIYKTLRIHYLGDLPKDDGYNIASQILWLNIIFEVVFECLMLPLFFILGKSLGNKIELDNRIKTGVITTSLIYLILVLITYYNTENLLLFLKQKESIINISKQYIQLESFSILLLSIYKFAFIILVLLNRIKGILAILVIQTLLTIVSDYFLISKNTFSLDLGVIGIAYGNIIVNCLLIFISIYILKKKRIILFKKTKLDFTWQKQWFKLGSLSGLESLIRNTIFFLFIIRWINMIEGQSYFWISNTFIWSWILIPVLALGELIKKEVSENNLNFKNVVKSSVIMTFLIVILWIVSIPFWSFFFKEIMNVRDSEIIFDITIISLIFYIVFAYNNIIDSVFYGLGRTDLMLIQSLIINLIYYGIVYLLIEVNFIIIELNKIIVIFGIGILLDSVVTLLIYRYNLKNDKLLYR